MAKTTVKQKNKVPLISIFSAIAIALCTFFGTIIQEVRQFRNLEYKISSIEERFMDEMKTLRSKTESTQELDTLKSDVDLIKKQLLNAVQATEGDSN